MLEVIKTHQLDEKLWAIDEREKTVMYIIDGGNKVLVLDTGSGVIDLQKVVRNLCGSKEIVVVNTHAHVDHNFGNNQFQEVYVGRYDELESYYLLEKTNNCEEMVFLKDGLTEDELRNWNPGIGKRILTLKDGDIIRIGNFSFLILEVPSHTIGSIALLEEKKGWLFTGDIMLAWPVWAWLQNSATLKQYYNSISYLYDMEKFIHRIFPSHGQEKFKIAKYSKFELPTKVIKIYKEGINNIISGTVEVGDYFYDGIIQGVDCSKIMKRMVAFKIGGIIFDPTRIGIQETRR